MRGVWPVFVGRVFRVVLALSSLLGDGAPALASEFQTLNLRRGWNLVSFSVEPTVPTVEAVLEPLIVAGHFRSLWAYDPATRSWASFPETPDGERLDTIATGVGYWIDMAADAKLVVRARLDAFGDPVLPAGPTQLYDGWNLVGFVLDGPVPYDRVLQGLPVRQVWNFEAAPSQKRFRGVVLGAVGGAPVQEDFTRIEPGRGYWVFSGEVADARPLLRTSLPSDVDVLPLVGEAGDDPFSRIPFTEFSAGDIDAGADGFYDRPPTQRAIAFGDFSDVVNLTIGNDGAAALAWRVRVADPEATPWLRLRNDASITCRGDCPVALEGILTTESATLDVVVDRSGFGPGTYTGTLLVESNAGDAEYPLEPYREIAVSMEVPPLDGDYEVTVAIETINGQPADLAQPQFFMGVYRDAEGLKAIIDGRRSLLFPEYCVGGPYPGAACGSDGDCGSGGRCEHHVRLAGDVYAGGTNRFQLSGSFVIPAAENGLAGCPNPEAPADEQYDPAPDNPFDVDLRRDITLRGDRPKLGDTVLGPQDLTGTYFETLRNVLGDPIQLRGTFVAQRRRSVASAIDDQSIADTPTAPQIPDGDPSGREYTKSVTDNLLLSEVDVAVDISHPQPSDLELRLVSPDGKVALLRERGHPGPAASVVYDQTEPVPDPLQGLDQFVGDLSAGTWTLLVIDHNPEADTRGLLRSWELQLRGTRVNDIAGTIGGAPAGTPVMLTGCGQVRLTLTDAGGAYAFRNLIDCTYKVELATPALIGDPAYVPLQGADATADLTTTPVADPGSAPTNCSIEGTPALCNPADASFRIERITTLGGAGLLQATSGALVQEGKLAYMPDTADFDIDRPPLNPAINACPPGSCLEDSNAFVRDPVTGYLSRLDNTEIDVPQPPEGQGHRLTQTLGLPVMGTTEGGGYRLAIGVLP